MSETTTEPFVLTIKKNGFIYIEDTKISRKDLREKMKAIFSTRKNKQVYIKADKSVDYGVVAGAMAEVRAAGILNIGLVTIPQMSL